MTLSDKIKVAAEAIRPTLHVCFEPGSKDDYEYFIERLSGDLARIAMYAVYEAEGK